MGQALGWLGWDPEVALRTDVNVILLAIEGRRELLRMIFGGSDDTGVRASRATAAPKVVTADRFKELAKRHNSQWHRANRGRRNG